MKNSIFILSILFCCNLFCGCSESDSSDSRQESSFPLFRKQDTTGGTAIISGVYFSETITDNEVFINGVRAEITDATQNRLVITLP